MLHVLAGGEGEQSINSGSRYLLGGIAFLLTFQVVVPPDLAMKFFAEANSAAPRGAAPYLSINVSRCYFCARHSMSQVVIKITYHAMTAIPRKALTQLNTRATMPLAVKPEGNGATLAF